MNKSKLAKAILTTLLPVFSVSVFAEDTLSTRTDDTRQGYFTEISGLGSEHEIIDTDTRGDFDLKAPSAVSVSEMTQYINDQLQNNVTGFAFAINHLGGEVASGAWGAARTAVDGYAAMTQDTRMNVASVSKNITAVGLLHLLEEKGISIETPIGQWLPASWSRGYGFASPPELGLAFDLGDNPPTEYLTFKNLLQHKTGLDQLFQTLSDDQKGQWGNDWDGLEYVVSLNADPGAGYAYKNANFALMRVLMAHIILEASGIPVTKDNYMPTFLNYMDSVLFNPAGVYQVTCYVQNQYEHARFYNVYHEDVSGKLSETESDSCGGHANFHFSARDLANLASETRYNNNVLSDAQRTQMDNLKLGWMSNSSEIYSHGGDLFYSLNIINNGLFIAYDPKVTLYKELHTCIMKMPHNYEASLVINSNVKTGNSACGILKSAYLNAVQE